MNTLRIGVIALAALAVKADTVTTPDSRVWNGTATMQGGVLQLQARFANGSTTLQFGANNLRSIEFNPSTYNPTAIPKLPQPRGGRISGTVYTRDKKAHVCANVIFDSASVNCAGTKPENLPRQSVMRILIGQQ